MTHPLDPVNLTELIEICRQAGLGNIGRSANREQIYKALDGEMDPRTCPLEEYRERMEAHIQKNFRSIRTQLPGCNGRCVSYGCPDVIVQRCWAAFKDDMI
jgi:hypothetical protein